MKLRVLGCSGGIGAGLRSTSFLVDDDILIDAGTGVGDLTLDEMTKIRHIFLTHSHLDHVGCLPLLVDSIFDRIEIPIVVHAQRNTIKALQDHVFNWIMWPNFPELPYPDYPVMRYEPMEAGEVRTIGGRAFEMIPVNHIVPTVGYRVECDGKAFAYSGDTTTNDTFWDILNAREALDVLIVETAFSRADERLSRLARHYCSTSLAADIKKLRHQPAVYLTHRKPGAEDVILAECREAIKGHDLKQLSEGTLFQF
ncbi:MAG: 3',5'-cyclic-nucleotide phosphodiesterase [Gammaproteobacteria bacterium]|nr:3',5'-cyclic-nucleotide phosphodiesterase [Gammaproteobacteria bacterium]